MSEQYKAALVRALMTGALSAGATALTTWGSLPSPISGKDIKTLIVAAGTAFLAPLLTRGGGEGYYDTRRAETGDVMDSDVARRQPRAA